MRAQLKIKLVRLIELTISGPKSSRYLYHDVLKSILFLERFSKVALPSQIGMQTSKWVYMTAKNC